MTKLTPEQHQDIAATLANMTLSSGIGDRVNACSIAAINLALTNTLTDDIPLCMSLVIGNWIIAIQDAMPDAMRNSATWKGLLQLAAGTGREFEQERDLIVREFRAARGLARHYDWRHIWETWNPCGTLERLIAVGGQPTTALAS